MLTSQGTSAIENPARRLQVVVDMGPPILKAADIPTTLKPTREDGSVVAAPLEVDGLTWSVTCVSMGNPHCITFGCVGAEEVSFLDCYNL